jgi:sn-glycerol 3-phosphate transport system substrate-binding protein
VARSRNWGVALLVTLALVAGACGGGGGTEQSAGADDDPTAACPVEALDDATSPVEITVWHSMFALPGRVLDSLVKEYNDSQDRVVVKAENQGITPTELHRKIDQALPDRSLPAIIVPDDTKTRFIADSGMFVPASACFEDDPSAQDTFDDLLPIATASYTLDDQLWPASFSTYTALVFYNRSHFEAAGLDPDTPPSTITEMIEFARAIKAAQIGSVQRPIVLKAQSFILEWWLSGAGQELVNEENGRSGELPLESRFDNPVTRELLEQLQAAKAEGLLDVVPGTEGQADHLLAIAGQLSSMTVESSAATSTVGGVIEGTISAEDLSEELGVEIPAGLQLDLDIGAGPYPGIEAAGKGQVGGSVWYLSNTVPDEQQAAAWDFMKFLNSMPSQVRWGTEGSVSPVLKSAEDEPALIEAWDASLAGRWARTAYEVLSGIEPDFPGPVIGPYDEVRQALERCMDNVLLNDAPVGPAVEEADRAITSALERYAADVGG